MNIEFISSGTRTDEHLRTPVRPSRSAGGYPAVGLVRSTSPAHLGPMMAAQGKGGALLVESAKLQPLKYRPDGFGESADSADLTPGTMKYPDCICAEHREGRGRPDSTVRLSAARGAKDQEHAVNSKAVRRRIVVARSGLASVADEPRGGRRADAPSTRSSDHLSGPAGRIPSAHGNWRLDSLRGLQHLPQPDRRAGEV